MIAEAISFPNGRNSGTGIMRLFGLHRRRRRAERDADAGACREASVKIP
jgi:hypothetical protein